MKPAYKFQLDKRDLLFILIIFALAFTLRVLYLRDYSNTNIYPILPQSDSYSYYSWGRDIASGDILGNKAFMKWPLYAYLLGFFFKFFSRNLSIIYMLQFMSGAINCVLIYWIAARIFSRGVAFLAALLCATYSVFIFYEGLLIYTSLSLLLNSLFFVLLLSLQANLNKKNIFLLGLMLGICTITQANILIFGSLACFWLLLKERQALSGLVYKFSFFVLGLSIVIGAVTLRNYLVEKDFVLIAGNLGINFYIGNNPQTRGTFTCPKDITRNQEDMFRDSRIIAESDLGRRLKTSKVSNYWFDRSGEFISSEPLKFTKLLIKKLIYVFSAKDFVHDIEYHLIKDKIAIFKWMPIYLKIIFPFGLLGIFLGLRKFKETIFLYLILFTVSLSTSMFFVSDRYRIVMMPYFLIFAAYGVFSLWDKLRNKDYLKVSFLGLSLAAIAIFSNRAYAFANSIKIDDPNYNTPAFEYHLLMALGHELNSQYRSSIYELSLARQIEPDNRRAVFNLGRVYYRLNDLKEAEENFKEAVKLSPLWMAAYYNLGLIYNQQFRFREARAMLEKAVSLDPEDAPAHYQLGLSYKKTKAKEAAIREFHTALRKIHPWNNIDLEIIEKELRDLEK